MALTPWDIERMERDLAQLKELVVRKQGMLLLATTDERRNALRMESQAHKEAISSINRDIRENG